MVYGIVCYSCAKTRQAGGHAMANSISYRWLIFLTVLELRYLESYTALLLVF